MLSRLKSRNIGILGGGQLARMLCLRGSAMGLNIHILSPSESDPAAQVCRNWQKGNPNDPKDLESFFKKVQILTFESEFIDGSALAEAKKQNPIQIFPNPQLMQLLQDRLSQKKLLQKYSIPTARFEVISTKNEVLTILQRFSKGVVFKQRRNGYDGYGTHVVRNALDLRSFVKIFEKSGFDYIAEEFIPFKRELAFAVAINTKSSSSLPLVESFQLDSRCLWVKGPVLHSRELPLKKKIIQMLKSVGYKGLISFELFEDKNGDLLVNELAPRVHNSGHYSIEALDHDQFEMHLRAILGLKLPKVQNLKPGFAMYNLLGSGSQSPQLVWPNEATLHWYGKNENRKGRKMGHLTCLAKTPGLALKNLMRIRKEFRL